MALLTNKLKTRYKDWIENMCKSNHCPKKTFERPGKSGKLLHKATLNIASKSGSLKVKFKKKRGGSRCLHSTVISSGPYLTGLSL